MSGKQGRCPCLQKQGTAPGKITETWPPIRQGSPRIFEFVGIYPTSRFVASRWVMLPELFLALYLRFCRHVRELLFLMLVEMVR